MSFLDLTLDDVGERRLIRELLLPRYGLSSQWFGDDCVPIVPRNGHMLVLSTDPAPRPVAYEFGMKDPFHWGWLLAAVNLSDLAAAGAEPLGLLTSLTLPGTMAVSDFDRLLDGVDACCSASGTSVIGGNLKEAADGSMRCEGTAVGAVDGPLVRRSGAEPGDVVMAFGNTGGFWAAVLTLEDEGQLDREHDQQLADSLLRPRPQVGLGRALRAARVVKAGTDASDGLYGAILALTQDQGLGCIVESEFDLPPFVRHTAKSLGVDAFRLALGFGDMQLVCAVRKADVNLALEIGHTCGVFGTRIGEVTDCGILQIRQDGLVGEFANFDNERFTDESQFTDGIPAYRERLLTRPLWST